MFFTRLILTVFVAFGWMTATYAIPAATQSVQNLFSTSDTSKSDKLNVNTASSKDLGKIKGLSKAKAKNIELYRKKNGNFKALDDLKLVKGFKKMKPESFKLIQDQLRV